jgi:hypothetical protein
VAVAPKNSYPVTVGTGGTPGSVQISWSRQ